MGPETSNIGFLDPLGIMCLHENPVRSTVQSKVLAAQGAQDQAVKGAA